MDESKKKAGEELKIKYLPDDEGVEVDGERYPSLQNYFKHREEDLKENKE